MASSHELFQYLAETGDEELLGLVASSLGLMSAEEQAELIRQENSSSSAYRNYWMDLSREVLTSEGFDDFRFGAVKRDRNGCYLYDDEKAVLYVEVSRDGVEKAVTATAQRIAQFEQQMEVVKATEAMQRAQQAVTTSTVGASSSVSTAAESLKRLQTRQAERQARLDAAAQLEKVADGRDLDEKLAEAGIGGSNKSSAQDVLARLQRQQGE